MSKVIEQLRDAEALAPTLYCITTGAGAGLQSKIWSVCGVSSFFVGAEMPYDMEATERALGFKPTKYVSEETAVDLAIAAYLKAYKPGRRAIGLGMTCSVASSKEHRGDHRVIVSVFTETACLTLSVVIPKGSGEGQRRIDGNVSDDIALHLLQVAVGGVLDNSVIRYLQDLCGDPQIVNTMPAALDRVLAHPYFKADGSRGTHADIKAEDTVLYPGAFNPPHDGHRRGAKAALNIKHVCDVEDRGLDQDDEFMNRSETLVFTTTINSPHKPALTVAEMLQRVVAMRGLNFLLTKDDPLYLDKSNKFPGADIILGVDALERMLDPKWGVSPEEVVETFYRNKTRLFILGRVVGGVYLTCNDVLKKMGKDVNIRFEASIFVFCSVPFRMDISSSEIRNASNGS